MKDGEQHDHVGLLAGRRKDGSPFIEMIPARRVGQDLYEVLGTPGIAQGCAQGDEILVRPDGTHSVQRRGGNVALHVYTRDSFAPQDLDALRAAFAPLAGFVEAPANGRFAVVTIPVSSGFPAIEASIETWVAGRDDVEWNFGNVYDETGRPLDWWT